ncbi:Fpg/Nei family DNA glycosylase [Streptacidiphilus sp. EB129]|uniref:Fpg/Nei family DNA glycosylase n=1 Tax=Streptacidiphilus sp. EB129 TaxID=3156262 RepID=UPI003518051A
MPEGHTLHRLAARYREVFGGEPVHVSSPQGPFAPAALRLDGHTLSTTDAHGKNLFLGFRGVGWIHIHLGLYGKVRFGEIEPGGEAPAPVGQVRLRIADDRHYADLRGPTTCALISSFDKKDIQLRLGPDPLRAPPPGAPVTDGPAPAGSGTPGRSGDSAHSGPDLDDPLRAWQRISRSSTTVAALLMDQKVLAGVGNIYRAEVLFRQGIDPHLPGRELTRAQWDAIWADLGALMRDGVRDGWIDTVRPEHTPQAMGRAAREDAHGGEVYVYRRAHQPCLVCGTPVRTETHATRNLFWCPNCQPPHRR